MNPNPTIIRDDPKNARLRPSRKTPLANRQGALVVMESNENRPSFQLFQMDRSAQDHPRVVRADLAVAVHVRGDKGGASLLTVVQLDGDPQRQARVAGGDGAVAVHVAGDDNPGHGHRCHGFLRQLRARQTEGERFLSGHPSEDGNRRLTVLIQLDFFLGQREQAAVAGDGDRSAGGVVGGKADFGGIAVGNRDRVGGGKDRGLLLQHEIGGIIGLHGDAGIVLRAGDGHDEHLAEGYVRREEEGSGVPDAVALPGIFRVNRGDLARAADENDAFFIHGIDLHILAEDDLRAAFIDVQAFHHRGLRRHHGQEDI